MMMSRKMKLAGHKEGGEEEKKKNAYRTVVGKSEGKRPLGKPNCS
jgi:hypothetical protein